MADYRKRLSDMTPEERAEVAPAADNFEDLFGDRSETPTSVKAADVAVGLTPVGSAVEIGEELSKEDPSYAKIGVIAAGDVLGAAIPPAGIALKTLTGSGRGLVRDIDDLVDTGLTLQKIKQMGKIITWEQPDKNEWIYTTLYYKPKSTFNPNYTVREFDNDEWIVFPWEN